MFLGIEGKMVEVDQQTGKVFRRAPLIFKSGYHAGASVGINQLGYPGTVVREFAQRRVLIPVVGQIEITV